MTDIENLLAIARKKNALDRDGSWSQGAETYIEGLRTEIEEVTEEIPKRRRVYLEDELGDVLWDYLNILLCLESEADISIPSVLSRALRKYEERVSGVEAGESWSVVKERQSATLAEEHKAVLAAERNVG